MLSVVPRYLQGRVALSMAAAVTGAAVQYTTRLAAEDRAPNPLHFAIDEDSRTRVHHGPIRIFTGNAHPELASAIAKHIGVPLSDATVGRHSCGEVHVLINESVRDCDVFVIQPTCNGRGGPQEHLVELLIMLDAIHRSAAHRITAVIPLYGYARQNAKERSRMPISAKLVADMLKTAGADRVIAIELHAPQVQGFASYPIDNMHMLPILANEVQKFMIARGLRDEDVVVVSPDVGGVKFASSLAKKVGASLAIFSRQRRRPTASKEIDLVGDVLGKVCIIVDDLVDTAESITFAAGKLKSRGAQAVIGVTVHGVLSDPACDRINQSALEMVMVTDTRPLDDALMRCPKLRVVSVAPLLAKAILNIHTSDSVSALNDKMPTEGGLPGISLVPGGPSGTQSMA